KLIVACSELLDLMALDNLRFSLDLEVANALATPKSVDDAFKIFYEGMDPEMKDIYNASSEGDVQFVREDLDKDTHSAEAEDSNLIKLVNMIISEAIKQRASDIHIEPMERRLRVRYRIDGICHEIDPPPKRLQGPILARVKIMSEMDIAEKRKTQDGRIRMIMQGRDIDFRVSALPARHGESIVLRILDKQKALVDIEELGFHPSDHVRFNAIIKRPNGVFLVTGPTGSGKTTTLYAALKNLNQSDVKIITAENPVEYNITGINQCQVNHRIGLDFGRILRAMLRQAPNIILVGEIRDRETADIAVQAALTGHLVFSTLHTNDAPGAITRLIDMGVKPFLVATAIQAIMAQRLVRRLCPECREVVTPEEVQLKMIGLDIEDLGGRPVYGPLGCSSCKNTGYKGRIGIFEMLEMSPGLRELAFNKASSVKLMQEARMSGGMLTLQEDGVRKYLNGQTSFGELLRATHRDDL
ncbi:MAG: Flp pilus assembly complex ATPase component TadA, partial [Planctomycetes bacterium]|nr:Flp pilus assembly complex ATPase component TadA [Planctomycetota bacterium]